MEEDTPWYKEKMELQEGTRPISYLSANYKKDGMQMALSRLRFDCYAGDTFDKLEKPMKALIQSKQEYYDSMSPEEVANN